MGPGGGKEALANLYERESVEFQPVGVMLDGQPVLDGISYAIVLDGARPVDFIEAVVLAGKTGVMVQGLSRGTYRIFAKIVNSPELPVIDCGYFYVN